MEGSENKLIEDKLKHSIVLAKRVFSAVDQPKSVQECCFEAEKRVDQLSFMLKTLLSFITTTAKKSLYLRPVEHVLKEVEGTLKHTYDVVCDKFNLKSVIRRLSSDKTTDFKTLYRNLDDSIANMKWFLEVYDPKNKGAFGGIVVFLPPIVNSNPIFLLVWSCIATVQMGRRLSDRMDAIMSLVSLAENNKMYKKYIAEEGGLPPLVKLLEETDSLDAQIAVADALCTLTNDPEIMKKVVIVIVRFLEDDQPIEVQIEAVNLVATMADLDTEYDLDEGYVIWPIITLLSSEASADELKISCAKALWKLAAMGVSNCRTITETKALLCLAKLVEKEAAKLQYYCLMTIMEITAAAESDIQFRHAVFKTNSPSAMAVVDQLLRVIKESDDPTMLVPAIKSVGSLARIFPSRENRVIGLLVSLLYNKHLKVATEASIALEKFTSPQNYLSRHWKSVFEFISFSTLKILVGSLRLKGYYSFSNNETDEDYLSPFSSIRIFSKCCI
ncbi:hypothetical protein PTKIN_Ptkin02bG0243900 [Pterospermum kingtungense]